MLIIYIYIYDYYLIYIVNLQYLHKVNEEYIYIYIFAYIYIKFRRCDDVGFGSKERFGSNKIILLGWVNLVIKVGIRRVV